MDHSRQQTAETLRSRHRQFSECSGTISGCFFTDDTSIAAGFVGQDGHVAVIERGFTRHVDNQRPPLPTKHRSRQQHKTTTTAPKHRVMICAIWPLLPSNQVQLLNYPFNEANNSSWAKSFFSPQIRRPNSLCIGVLIVRTQGGQNGQITKLHDGDINKTRFVQGNSHPGKSPRCKAFG